jgi:cysteine desulfurase
MRRVYLDYNASTPIAAEVTDAMRPFLTEHYGNPSSHHWAGAPAKAALERARAQVASLLASKPEEIIFTSGGTEANNFAIKGVFFARRDRGNHIVTTQIEHPATLEPCRFLERMGAEVTYPVAIGTQQVATDYAGIQALPTAFLIGRDGRILAAFVGARDESQFAKIVRQAEEKDGVSSVVPQPNR